MHPSSRLASCATCLVLMEVVRGYGEQRGSPSTRGIMTVFTVTTTACKKNKKNNNNKIKTHKDDKLLNCSDLSLRWASGKVEKNSSNNRKCSAPERLLLGTEAACVTKQHGIWWNPSNAVLSLIAWAPVLLA